MAEEIDWKYVRANAYSPHRPDNWPPNVTAISMKGTLLLGIDKRTRELYWDSNRLITEKRFTDYERRLAIVGLTIGGFAAFGTIAQAVGACIWHC